MPGQRLLLWATRDPDTRREAVESAAREFELVARFCTPEELAGQLGGPRCDLIVLELDPEPARALLLLNEIHDRLPRTTIYAVSSDTSVPVIRAALEAGATDFLSLPLDWHELHKALIKFTRDRGRADTRQVMGDVIAVCGARGGLGATTVAVNLAVQLATISQAQTALVDLDLQRGDVCAFLNLSPMQSLAAVATARGNVDEIFLHSAMTRHPSGVFVLPAPEQMEEAEVIGHADVELVLRLLRGQFRYTIVDTPRTISGPSLAALEHADRVLMLSDLSVPGVRAAQRTFELLGRLGTPRERLELVVTHAVPGPVEPKHLARATGKEPFFVLPHDDAASKAMNAGTPLNGAAPTGISAAIGELAAKLSGLQAAPRRRGGHLLRRLFGKEARQ